MSDATIKLNTKALKEVEDKINRAVALTAHVLQDDIRQEQIIPRAEGTLQGEKFYVDDSGADSGTVSLVFEGPYARRLYYHPEYNFRKDKNPNAQGLWMRPWLRGGAFAKRPQEIFASILKRGI